MLWVTGVKGLVGSTFAQESQAVIGTGREVDIGDLDAVYQFLKLHPNITHVVNCAASTNVDEAERLRHEAYRANVVGPENLSLACNTVGAKLIHISTDYVFPGTGSSPLKEEDPTSPCNYYGETKLLGEAKVLKHLGCVIRTSWVFGRGGKSFGSVFLQKLLTEEVIRLTDDQWSRFTYAPDFKAAILQMLSFTGLYQYANAGVASRYEFGLAMFEEAKAMGFPVVTKEILPTSLASFPAKCERPKYTAFDTGKIEKIVSIRHWKETLRDYLNLS